MPLPLGELATLLDLVEECVAVFGRDGDLRHLNRCARTLLVRLGRDPERAFGRPWSELLPEDMEASVGEALGSVARGEAEEREVGLVPVRDMDLRVVVRGVDPETVSLHAWDITDLLRKEGARSEELTGDERLLRQYHLLLESYPFGSIVTFDEELRYRMVRGAAWSEVGIDPATLEGRAFDEVWPPETVAEFAPLARKALSGRTAKGRVHYAERAYEVVALPLDRDPAMGMFLSRDVTVEEEARRQYELVDRAVGSLMVGLTVASAEAGQPLVYANEGFERLTGYDRTEIVGRNCRFLQGPETDPAARAELRAAVEEKRRVTRDILNYRADGTTFWNRVTLAPIREAGRVTHYVGIQQDVSALRGREVDVERGRRLEELGALASGVAHDFNNSLTVLRGNLALLASDGAADPELVGEMVNEVARASELVDRLLSYARKSSWTPGPLELGSALAALITGLQRLLPDNVSVRMDLPQEDVTVSMDETRLEQILLNLTTNARDAMMPDGGIIQITLRGDGERAELAVSDTGIGIPPENMERVFEPFFTTKGDRGTGLGLASVAGIVKRAGGDVEVASSDHGTTFRLRLPVIQFPDTFEEPEPPPAPEHAPSHGLEGQDVLLVEDSPAVQRLVRRLLERAGAHVETLDSGAEALQLIREDPCRFDVVVTDLSLPGARGDALLQETARLCEGQPNAPILVLISGNLDQAYDDLPRHILKLAKPFDIDFLVDLLSKRVAAGR